MLVNNVESYVAKGLLKYLIKNKDKFIKFKEICDLN